MAIEFDCPYCTATIRVPDAYGGKQGRCPKCDTRLLVPMVVRPGSATIPDGSAPPATTERPNDAAMSFPTPDAFSIKPTTTTPSRRRNARRRPSRALVVGMPVLCFLVLLAVIFFSVTGSLPELSGELTAKRLENKTLPGITIPWSDTGLLPEDVQTLKEFLNTNPETLASEVMTCRMIGTDAGIEVRLTSGAGSDWFVVDTTTSKPLALWLKKERSSLNTQRISLMRASLVTYCKDKLAQISGEPLAIDAVSVRDNVGINACGGALSFSVHGVVGNRLVPCAYEDERGMLYFCLPKETQGFQIPGRTLADGTKPFGGEFTAVVAGIAHPPADTSGTPDSSSETTPPSTDDTTMPDSDSDSDPESKMKNSDEKMGDESDGKMMDESESEMESEMKMDSGMKSDSMKNRKQKSEPMMDENMMDGEMMDKEKMLP